MAYTTALLGAAWWSLCFQGCFCKVDCDRGCTASFLHQRVLGLPSTRSQTLNRWRQAHSQRKTTHQNSALAMAGSNTAAGGGATRLLLTNLHPSVSSASLRTHLERCPSPSNAATLNSITDLKVLSRPDGTSRCIAFAGFKRHQDADRVREWLDGTWVAGDRGGARIKADWAKEASSFGSHSARPTAAHTALWSSSLCRSATTLDRTSGPAVMTRLRHQPTPRPSPRRSATTTALPTLWPSWHRPNPSRPRVHP